MALISLVIIAVISCVICSALAESHTCVSVANEVRRSVAAGYFHLGLLMCFMFQKQLVLFASCRCCNKVISLMASIKYAYIDFLTQALAF